MIAKKTDTFFLAGLFFINMIAVVLILASLGFAFNAPLSFWQFPLAVVIALVINYSVSRSMQSGFKTFWLSIIGIAAVFIVSLLIANYFYDLSYDGQSYHQEAIFQLDNGWVPFYNLLPDAVKYKIFIDHYAKGVEISQTAIYSITHHIETGKSTNIMMLGAAFCLTFSYLLKLEKLSKAKCILLSLLITLNPVTINQLLTYYVDGQLATVLLCFIIAALLIVKEPKLHYFILLASIIIIAVNIKFTAIIYIALFSAAILAWAIFTKKPGLTKSLFITTFAAGIVGVFFIGFNPYVVNTTKFGHPFYPLMGDHKIDIMSVQYPEGFKDKNPAAKFFIATFSHTYDKMPLVATLKVPLTVNKDDIIDASRVDAHIAGFGPFFSGILILSIALLVILYIQQKGDRGFKNILYLLLCVALSVAIIAEAWWARYVPQLWIIPLIILIATELYPQKKYVKFARGVTYFLIVLNIGICMIGIVWNYFLTSLVNYQLAELKASHQTISVDWGSATANRIRFREHDIPYKETKLDSAKAEILTRSDSKFILPANTPQIPKSVIEKWAEKLVKDK